MVTPTLSNTTLKGFVAARSDPRDNREFAPC
jgi:hypothetical protein